ncbi:hemagluttinin family protein [Escherichia coli]|nr:hemagluttinin family protein [Escherichia coli]
MTNLDTRVTNIENGIGDIVTTGSTKYFKTNTDGVDANAQGKTVLQLVLVPLLPLTTASRWGTGSVANEENTISVVLLPTSVVSPTLLQVLMPPMRLTFRS